MAAAVVLRIVLDRWLSGAGSVVLLVAAVLLAAWVGGIDAGLVAAALAALAGAALISHELPLRLHGAANVGGVAIYAITCGLLVAWGERQRRVRDLADRWAEDRRRADERLATTLGSLSEAVLAADAAGRLTYMNPQAERLTGWTADEAAGHPWSDVLHLRISALPPDGTAPFDMTASTGPARGAGMLTPKEGRPRTVEYAVAPVVGADGSRHGTAVTLRDTSGEMESAWALRQQAELLDLADDAIFVHDLQGHITYWNSGAEGLYGWARDEARGCIVHELLQTQFPESLALVKRTLHDTGRWAGELRHVRRDGQTVLVTSKWALQRDIEGQPVGVLEITRDVTSHRRQEQALRDSETRLRTILNTAVDGIITITEDGTIESFNPAAERLFGYAAEEVIGQNVRMLMPNPYSDEHDGYLTDYLRSGQAKILGVGREVEGLRRDGTTVPLDLAVSEVWLGSRRIFTGMIRDISERRRLEGQLLQAQKMEGIGRLAGGVAHDFNNLLTAIIGYTELAQEAVTPDSAARAYLENVTKAATRAAGLTRQLLAFARKQIIEPRVVNLNDLIMDVDKMLRRIIGEDVELVTVPKPGLGSVKVDASQFEQILVNLAVNARDAMPSGGKLTIETDNVTLDDEYARQHPEVSAGEYVMLGVSDTGQGMTDEVRARIFEPFFTTKEQGKGTGLGLATCYGIVKQSGGHIWVYSEPGRGTAFKVYLPRVPDTTVSPAREEPLRVPSGAETVLIVEDEEMVRKTASQALSAQGYTILEAVDGEEGLRVAAGYPGHIDLVVTDVVMPRMGGKEMVDRLLAERPGTRVLYTSGYTDQAIVHHGVLEPGILFIQKPFTPAGLARKVREALDAPQ